MMDGMNAAQGHISREKERKTKREKEMNKYMGKNKARQREREKERNKYTMEKANNLLVTGLCASPTPQDRPKAPQV